MPSPLSDDLARRLGSRISDLQSAASISDLIAGDPTRISDTELSIALDADHRLVVAVNHPSTPRDVNGSVDWSRVRRVRIERIEGPTDGE